MALSVEAALQLEVFRRTPMRIFAGQENLGCAVRWVHPVEVPDIARFLTGGEMLLTAGLGIGRTPELQRKYIQEVADAGAVVLIIELSGRAFTTMPTALVDEAERRHFPLIGLEGELPFVEVSAQIHEFLVDQRTSELATFEHFNVTLMRLLLASSDPNAFIETLAYQVGQPVVLEDAGHEVVAYAGATSDSDHLMKNWGLHAQVLHRPDTSLAVPGNIPGPAEPAGCTRRSIVLRGERCGWLHIMHGADCLSSVHSYALDRTADAIAITFLGDRESGVRASQRQSSLVNRLLLGDITGEQFIDRSLKVGRDLRDRSLVVVFTCKEPGKEMATGRVLESMLRPLRLPAVVADIGDHGMAVIGLTQQLSEPQLVCHLEKRGVHAGISRSCTAAELPDAIQQARTAASVAAAQKTATVLRFDALGVLRLLASLSRGPELARYVEDELGALLTHDSTTTNPLLPTLRAYLACDGNKSHAADELFVQRRTLYYRLERLNALLGKSLEDSEVRQSLGLAIRAFDFLRAQESIANPSRSRGAAELS